MGTRTLEPNDPEAKRYEDLRKANTKPGKELPKVKPAEKSKGKDDDTED